MSLTNIVVTALSGSSRASDVARLTSASRFSTTHYTSLESLWANEPKDGCVAVICVPEEDPERALRHHEFANNEGLPFTFCYCVEKASLPFVVKAVQLGAVDVFDHNVSSSSFDDILQKSKDLLKVRQDQVQEIRRARSYVNGLSERQKALLPLLLNGYTNKAAAAELEISIKTVEKHRQIIIRKAQVNNLVEIASVFSTSQQSIAEACAYVPVDSQELTGEASLQRELVS